MAIQLILYHLASSSSGSHEAPPTVKKVKKPKPEPEPKSPLPFKFPSKVIDLSGGVSFPEPEKEIRFLEWAAKPEPKELAETEKPKATKKRSAAEHQECEKRKAVLESTRMTATEVGFGHANHEARSEGEKRSQAAGKKPAANKRARKMAPLGGKSQDSGDEEEDESEDDDNGTYETKTQLSHWPILVFGLHMITRSEHTGETGA
ncbi:unnamed protein product [Fusarium equiseti]|uniref:Uncharacterized protein n=1 Tax=Fusarium equiseti TaxID=61235 RepID=A0A8J2IY35_FUSEQ|nr:unnamed protein product [Fusarium equiseti]